MREFRVIAQKQFVSVNILSRKHLHLELRGLIDSSGMAKMHPRSDGNIHVELDENIIKHMRSLHARIESTSFDAAKDVAIVRVRPGWLPVITLHIPRVVRSPSSPSTPSSWVRKLGAFFLSQKETRFESHGTVDERPMYRRWYGI